jgi:hypothetical protein
MKNRRNMIRIKVVTVALMLLLCISGVAHGSLCNEHTLTGKVFTSPIDTGALQGDRLIVIIDTYTSPNSFAIYLNNSTITTNMTDYTSYFNSHGQVSLIFNYGSRSESINIIFLINGIFDIRNDLSSLYEQMNMTLFVKDDGEDYTTIPPEFLILGSGLAGFGLMKRMFKRAGRLWNMTRPHWIVTPVFVVSPFERRLSGCYRE